MIQFGKNTNDKICFRKKKFNGKNRLGKNTNENKNVCGNDVHANAYLEDIPKRSKLVESFIFIFLSLNLTKFE